jgi:molybdopterin synthase sulfur carrier subunit
MARLRLFGPARVAAGESHAQLGGRNVAEVIAAAEARYGPAFADVLAISRVWVNGEPANADVSVADQDEVAVIPPVSGG